MEQELKHLLDEREIRNVLYRYCRGVDRCDAGLIASCYHEDALDDHGNWCIPGSEVADYILQNVKPGPARAMHFLGNMLIEFDGDQAFVESYVLAFRVYDRDAKSYTRTRALRFIDRFEKRNGAWRISERVVADEWNRVDEVLEFQQESALFRPGSKDQDDPVYQIRKGTLAGKPRQ